MKRSNWANHYISRKGSNEQFTPLLEEEKYEAYNQIITYLLTDELSLGAFISINRFLIITSSPAHAAAALTSSSDRPYINILNEI